MNHPYDQLIQEFNDAPQGDPQAQDSAISTLLLIVKQLSSRVTRLENDVNRLKYPEAQDE